MSLLSIAVPVSAHRLDEYLQAVIVSVGQDQIRASVRLVPGTAVASKVIAEIDSNGDGVFSDVEQRTYTEAVLHDLSLSIDGRKIEPNLETASFPPANDMREGTGEIYIEFKAESPSGKDSHRTLVVENHHEPGMSVYLMNCSLPQDGHIQIVSQNRNPNQSFYRVDYMQSEAALHSSRIDLTSALSAFAGVPNMFRLGMRHIAEGTDHLLFLLVLLLPAPLMTAGGRSGRILRRSSQLNADLPNRIRVHHRALDNVGAGSLGGSVSAEPPSRSVNRVLHSDLRGSCSAPPVSRT